MTEPPNTEARTAEPDWPLMYREAVAELERVRATATRYLYDPTDERRAALVAALAEIEESG